MQGYLLGILLFLLAIGIFIYQNTALVTVKFITWQSPRVSIAIVALVALLVGCLLIFMINGARYLKMGRTVRNLQARNRKLEREIQKLKTTADHRQPVGAAAENEAVGETEP